MRNMTTQKIARQLGVSEQTVRYHARLKGVPCDRTPGGHRRYDLREVQAALYGDGLSVGREIDFPPHGARISLDEPTGELTPSMRLELDATTGYDEQQLDATPDEPLPEFEIYVTYARRPQHSDAVGAGA